MTVGGNRTTSLETYPAQIVVIDELDTDLGTAEVQDSQGRSLILPAEWLPGAADGAGYRVSVVAGQVTFTPEPAAAHLLREQSKQMLLDFSDEPGAEQ